jgi:hypothetical protein
VLALVSAVKEGIAGAGSGQVEVRCFDGGIRRGVCIRVGEGSVAVFRNKSMDASRMCRCGLPELSGSGKPVCLLRTLISLAGKSWTLLGMIV